MSEEIKISNNIIIVLMPSSSLFSKISNFYLNNSQFNLSFI